MDRPARILDLPNPLLEAVLVRPRIFFLPTCRRLHQLANSSRVLWEDLHFSRLLEPAKVVRVAAWLRSNAGVRKLSFGAKTSPEMDIAVHFLLGALAGTKIQELDLYDALTANTTAPWIAGLPSLESLILQGDNITLSAELASLTCLTLLVLRREEGWPVTVPEGSLPASLRSLWADWALNAIQPGVAAATSLRTLGIDNLMEETLDTRGLERLSALTALKLHGCLLAALPEQLSALVELRVLDLSSNPLGDGLEGGWELLAVLQQLSSLCLHDCKLTELPGEVASLRALRQLDVGFSPIRSISTLPIPFWSRLEALGIRPTGLAAANEGAMLGMVSLRLLYLAQDRNAKNQADHWCAPLLRMLGHLPVLEEVGFSPGVVAQLAGEHVHGSDMGFGLLIGLARQRQNLRFKCVDEHTTLPQAWRS